MVVSASDAPLLWIWCCSCVWDRKQVNSYRLITQLIKIADWASIKKKISPRHYPGFDQKMILRFLHWLPASATSSQHQESVVINTVHVFLYLFYLQIFRFYLHEISTFCCFVRVMMPNLESHLTSLSSATTNAQYSTSCIIHVKHLYIWNTYDKKYAKFFELQMSVCSNGTFMYIYIYIYTTVLK